MHLSEKSGIRSVINFESGKIKDIDIHFIDSGIYLYERHQKDEHISYKVFANRIKTVFDTFKKVLRQLHLEPAYNKILIFSCLFKYNQEVEIEVSYRAFHLAYGKFGYEIKNSLKVSPEKSYDPDDYLLKQLDTAVKTIDSHTKYTEISNSDFMKELDGRLYHLLPYLEAPKFLRKKEYKI